MERNKQQMKHQSFYSLSLAHSHNLFSAAKPALIRYSNLAIKEHLKTWLYIFTTGLKQSFWQRKRVSIPPFRTYLTPEKTGWNRDVCSAANSLSVSFPSNYLGGREHSKIVT